MDFHVISASEVVEAYRDYCQENFPGRFLHFYPSIESQLAGGNTCSICQHRLLANFVGPCVPESDLRENTSVQLMVSGSPCDPFSTQRAKRFRSGSVVQHSQVDITLSDVISLYRKYEPEKGILEQVWGFTLRFSEADPRTPKDRPTLGVFFVFWVSILVVFCLPSYSSLVDELPHIGV